MQLKNILLYIILFVCFMGFSQRPPQQIFNTEKGDLIVQPILHGTLVLQWNNETIYVDPYGGATAFDGIADPTIVLITDIHGDHLDKSTLETMNTDAAIFIAPSAVAEQIPDTYKSNLTIINNGEIIEKLGIEITAIAMYNLPEEENSKHPKGRGNGYILKMGGKTVYISGDTEDITEMRNLKNIDIAFICMNLPYTMDVDQAASAVLEFQPKVVFPYHYRGNPDMSDTSTFKKLVHQGNRNIDVRLVNWYPEYK